MNAQPRAPRSETWSPRGVAAVLTRHSRRIAWMLAGLVAVGGAGYAAELGQRVRYLDERVYLQLATYLVHGHGYTADGLTPTAYRPPGYPFMLALIDFAHGGIFAMRMLNFVALAASVLLVHRLALRIARPAVAVLAAVVTAVYPLFIYAAGTLYPQTVAGFLLLASLAVMLRATDPDVATRRRWQLALFAGLLLGILTETVPTFGPTAVALCALPLLRRTPAKKALAGVAVLAFAALPVAWCVRNAVEMHALIPVSTNNGVNILLGNSEHANAFGGRVVDISQYEDPAHAEGLGEVALDHRFTSDALTWIRQHPGRASVLYVEKLASNFTYSSPLATEDRNSTGKDLLSAVSYYPILLLAVVRILLWRRAPLSRLERGIFWLIVGNVCLLAVFYTRLRFRIPLDTLTIVLAAGGVEQLTRQWSKRGARRTGGRANLMADLSVTE
jgi:4-amino-4-deoxy-L-arabinose transferase-like glycosyltransferase